jgi:hypothetical protein
MAKITIKLNKSVPQVEAIYEHSKSPKVLNVRFKGEKKSVLVSTKHLEQNGEDFSPLFVDEDNYLLTKEFEVRDGWIVAIGGGGFVAEDE